MTAHRDGDDLVVAVEDDGPGTSGEESPPGVGLSATAERLALLHRGHQRFEAGNQPGGGFLVRIVLPYRTAESGTTALLEEGPRG